jgi:predicted nucleic acid-binding Zn finger protein
LFVSCVIAIFVVAERGYYKKHYKDANKNRDEMNQTVTPKVRKPRRSDETDSTTKRKQRALQQNIKLINSYPSERPAWPNAYSFQVIGTTNNSYIVAIDRIPFCSCPDSKKSHHCKHVMFVLVNVFGYAVEHLSLRHSLQMMN